MNGEQSVVVLACISTRWWRCKNCGLEANLGFAVRLSKINKKIMTWALDGRVTAYRVFFVLWKSMT